jgi:hypothetical protein
VLTVASIPKPFVGTIGDLQRNALASWRAIGSDTQILLLGDETGVGEAAEAAGAEHVAALERDASGTPRLDSAFAHLRERARHAVVCFVNADIVFLDDVPPALAAVSAFAPRFLTIGQSRDLPVEAGAVGAPGWQSQLRDRALRDGRFRGAGAIDYFLFDRDLFADVPPFAIGRAGFDNWLIWRARSLDVPVVDATADIAAVHQSHDYAHLAGGKLEAYLGDEAAMNVELAGGKAHLFSICDASHRLRGGRVTRNPWAAFRIGDRVRRARWKLGLDRAA